MAFIPILEDADTVESPLSFNVAGNKEVESAAKKLGQGLRRICSNVRGTNTVLNYPGEKQGLLRKTEGALDIF